MNPFKFDVCSRASFYINDHIGELNSMVETLAVGAGEEFPSEVLRKVGRALSSIESGNESLNQHCIFPEDEDDYDVSQLSFWYDKHKEEIKKLQNTWKNIDLGE